VGAAQEDRADRGVVEVPHVSVTSDVTATVRVIAAWDKCHPATVLREIAWEKIPRVACAHWSRNHGVREGSFT